MRDNHQPSHNAPASAPLRAAGLFALRYGVGGAMIMGGIVVLLTVGGDPRHLRGRIVGALGGWFPE